MSGYLEAPKDEYWGFTLKHSDIRNVAQQGFDTIRLSTRWSDYASDKAPYKIDNSIPTPTENVPNDGPGIFTTVDRVLRWSQKYDLKVILNIHHYDELYRNADTEKARFLAIWTHLSERYKDVSNEDLIFEIINEPRDDSGNGTGMTIAKTNEYNALALDIIRKTNPERSVIYGTGEYGSISGVEGAKPPKDKNLIMSVHYYEPFDFTHQGAEFLSNPPAYPAKFGTRKHKKTIEKDFDHLHSLSEKLAMPIFVGEYGAIRNANTNGEGPELLVDEDQRGNWTAFVKDQIDRHGFTGCYFDYGTSYAAYDQRGKKWIPQIISGLTD